MLQHEKTLAQIRQYSIEKIAKKYIRAYLTDIAFFQYKHCLNWRKSVLVSSSGSDFISMTKICRVATCKNHLAWPATYGTFAVKERGALATFE